MPSPPVKGTERYRKKMEANRKRYLLRAAKKASKKKIVKVLIKQSVTVEKDRYKALQQELDEAKARSNKHFVRAGHGI